MGCSSCGGTHKITSAPTTVQSVIHPNKTVSLDLAAPVEASEDVSRKIRLRYYGGGVTKIPTGTGCSTCRSGKKGYANTTTETITFVSADAPGGLFRQTVTVGHDIYVTEKQAEYLLALTYQNKGGQIVHKFQKVED